MSKKQQKCLSCYKPIDDIELLTPAGRKEFHTKCSKKIFGKIEPPIIGFTEEELSEFAEKIIRSQKAVTGVQPKLSLGFEEKSTSHDRFTIVGFKGEYILKPQTKHYSNLPENEDLTMHLAALSGLQTVQHTLVRLQSGELAYLTKRIDRIKDKKRHMEDMCQLTERQTEHKYNGSHEQITKAIRKYSSNPGLDTVNFYELVLFSFLTGNSDMHLKNFSLLKLDSEYNLCPAYDLVATKLVMEKDLEDLALNLNGKKNKIKRKDFEIAMKSAGINQKVIDNIFKKYRKLTAKWQTFIDHSFLPKASKLQYKELIAMKAKQIEL